MKASERKTRIGAGVSIVSVAVIAILIAGASYHIPATGAASTSPVSTIPATIATHVGTTSPSPSSASPPETVRVSIPDGVASSSSSNFQPGTITLVIGVNNTVVWTNNDSAPHTVTATSVPYGETKFSSGNMNSGTTFTYTFKAPGTYSYQCSYHYWMQGTIVVEQSE